MKNDCAYAENVGRALQMIEEAQSLLYAACRALSPCDGLAEHYSRAADLGKACNNLWDDLEMHPFARTPGPKGEPGMISANVYRPAPAHHSF